MNTKLPVKNDEINKSITPPRLPEIFKHEILEVKGEASFEITFMIQSHAECMKKIVGAL